MDVSLMVDPIQVIAIGILIALFTILLSITIIDFLVRKVKIFFDAINRRLAEWKHGSEDEGSED